MSYTKTPSPLFPFPPLRYSIPILLIIGIYKVLRSLWWALEALITLLPSARQTFRAFGIFMTATGMLCCVLYPLGRFAWWIWRCRTCVLLREQNRVLIAMGAKLSVTNLDLLRDVKLLESAERRRERDDVFG
ncbi:hypothetical protein EDC01DRAFT_776682 [Geopyxis carbonaria]|nr:hypothetical protein EDC01DRAFT_776682 [Geopyxis carbonaria]